MVRLQRVKRQSGLCGSSQRTGFHLGLNRYLALASSVWFSAISQSGSLELLLLNGSVLQRGRRVFGGCLGEVRGFGGITPYKISKAGRSRIVKTPIPLRSRGGPFFFSSSFLVITGLGRPASKGGRGLQTPNSVIRGDTRLATQALFLSTIFSPPPACQEWTGLTDGGVEK